MSLLDSTKNTMHGFYKKMMESVTSEATKSEFQEKGTLTPSEFVIAGDQLVTQCPTWTWEKADENKNWPFLGEKQFLQTRKVPCLTRVASLVHNADDREKIVENGEWLAMDDEGTQQNADQIADIDDIDNMPEIGNDNNNNDNNNNMNKRNNSDKNENNNNNNNTNDKHITNGTTIQNGSKNNENNTNINTDTNTDTNNNNNNIINIVEHSAFHNNTNNDNNSNNINNKNINNSNNNNNNDNNDDSDDLDDSFEEIPDIETFNDENNIVSKNKSNTNEKNAKTNTNSNSNTNEKNANTNTNTNSNDNNNNNNNNSKTDEKESDNLMFKLKQDDDGDTIVKTRTYDISITYDKYYKVPRIWLRGYDENGNPLTSAQIFEDISGDHAHKTVTVEGHPHLANVICAGIHPCRHSEVMKRFMDRMESGGTHMTVEQYMFLFLKFMAAIIPTIEYDFTKSVQQ